MRRKNVAVPRKRRVKREKLGPYGIQAGTIWRQRILRRVSGGLGPTFIALLERTRAPVEPLGEAAFVFCGGMLQKGVWAEGSLGYEPPLIRIVFPREFFVRMPFHLFIEPPTEPAVGSRWYLLGEDQSRLGTVFQLTEEFAHPATKIAKLVTHYRGIDDWRA